MGKSKNIMSEFAIASLVLGIISFIPMFRMEKPLLAIIFGILALQGIKRQDQLGGGKLAIAGIILGIFAIIAIIVLSIRFTY